MESTEETRQQAARMARVLSFFDTTSMGENKREADLALLLSMRPGAFTGLIATLEGLKKATETEAGLLKAIEDIIDQLANMEIKQ